MLKEVNNLKLDLSKLTVEPLDRKDLEAVVNLFIKHIATIYSNSDISFKFTKYYYESFLNSLYNYAFVAKTSNEIVGYLCLVKNHRELYFKPIKNHLSDILIDSLKLFYKNPFLYSIIIIDKIILIINSIIIKIRKSKYPGKKSYNNRGMIYEIRPMVVRKDYQGTLVARTLISHAEEFLKGIGENKYSLRVLKDNSRAINFYYKVGFKLVGEDGNILTMEKTLLV